MWELLHRADMVNYIKSNQIDASTRRGVVWFSVGGLVVALLGVAATWVRRRRHAGDFATRIETIGWRVSPLCVAAVVPLLFQWQAWRGRDIQFLLIVAIAAFVLQKLWFESLQRRSLAQTGRDTRWARLCDRFGDASSWLPWVIVGLAVVFYASYFSFFTIRNHWNLRTAAYDMAIEDNVVFNAMRGELLKASPMFGPEGSHLGHHATFFAFLLAPFYALAPRAETLLVLQAILIGAAAIPLFLFARRRLGPYQGALIAVLYIFYAPLHGANLYDFHYPPLGIGFVFWLVYFVDTGRFKWAAVALLLCLSIREDIALAVFAVGAYFLLSGVRPRAGLALAAVGVGYFLLMKMAVMPSIQHGKHTFVWYYEKLVPKGGPKGFSGVLMTMFGNPGYTFGTLLESTKIKYFLQVLVPFAFLPFRKSLGFLFCVPAMIMTLLASRSALYEVGFQYSAHWALGMFVASVAILTMLREPLYQGDSLGPARVSSWLAAMVFAMAATSYQHGAILQHHTARGGFSSFKFSRTPNDIKQYNEFISLTEQIPPEAVVAATSRALPHVSNRPNAYTIRTVGIRDAEYLLFPFHIGGTDLDQIRPKLEEGSFGIVDVAGRFMLAKRGHATARNAEVLKRIRKPKKKPKPKSK